MSTFERRPSLTSYDIEKAVEADRDNKFSRGRGRQRATEASVFSTEEGVLRISTADDSSGPPTAGDQPSVDPTPHEKPFAGMRAMGQVRAGVDKLYPAQPPGRPGRLTRRISIAENVQQLGKSMSSPISPGSPASPSTIRSPLRFFRRREDVRDSIIANTKTAREQEPVKVLRERVKEEGVVRMDEDWERHQRPSLLLQIWNFLSSISAYLQTLLFSGWGPWFRRVFAIGEDSLQSYLTSVKALPLHSLPRLRALEAILNLSYSYGNQLVMVQNGMRGYIKKEI